MPSYVQIGILIVVFNTEIINGQSGKVNMLTLLTQPGKRVKGMIYIIHPL